jgi:hypothetical protein
MILIPSPKLFPELGLFDERERPQALNLARKSIRHVWILLSYVVVVLLVMSAAFIVWQGIMPHLLATGVVRDVFLRGVVQVSVTLLALLATGWLWRRRIRRSLREQLQMRGVAICLVCGYDLRGQIQARCSECGTPFDKKLLGSATAGPDSPGRGPSA